MCLCVGLVFEGRCVCVCVCLKGGVFVCVFEGQHVFVYLGGCMEDVWDVCVRYDVLHMQLGTPHCGPYPSV